MARRRVRTALFTPGTEASRLRRAVTAGADVCIFDLEDSVPLDRIGEARETVREALDELGDRTNIWVRVHAVSTSAMIDDLSAIPLQKTSGIMLPKVGGAAELAECRNAMLAAGGSAQLPLIPIIESAAGVVNLTEIARAPDVLCLAYGRFDLSADIGIDPEAGSPALAAARGTIVLHSASAALHPPLDSPWLQIKDLDGLRKAAQRARADGFGGMLLIHPTHVTPVNQVFSPTAEEIEWAQGLMASASEATAEGRGAYAREGSMVDEAIIRRARRILEDNTGRA
jgi:citrate lyase beta subunit